MCNLYNSTPRDRLPKLFGKQVFGPEYLPQVAPLRNGPFVTRDRIVVGQWGLIPYNSKTRKPTRTDGKPMSTNNARIETIASAWTYRFPWKDGRRCLIPADSYDEPYWGTGKNIWWRFARADGMPWALAGIWSEWTDPESGEVVPSYSMITQNCDAHPLLSLMHKPDPKCAPDMQDKRAVVPIAPASWEQWLHGSIDEAAALITLPATDEIAHQAADPTKTIALPI